MILEYALMLTSPHTVLFLGPQGSGKGTQADILIAKFYETDSTSEVVSLQAGRELRKLATQGTYTARLAREAMVRGELLPLFLSINAFAQYVAEHITESAHMVVDGFPRGADQLLSFDSAMQFYHRDVVHVVYLNISNETAQKRLNMRKRDDDSEESINSRLAWSRALETEMHEWFKCNSRYVFHNIDGEKSVEEVSNDIYNAISST